MRKPKMLPPGVYSMIVLIDDGSWIQPAYRTTEAMTEDEFRRRVECKVTHNAFMFLSVAEDPDAPEDYIRPI